MALNSGRLVTSIISLPRGRGVPNCSKQNSLSHYTLENIAQNIVSREGPITELEGIFGFKTGENSELVRRMEKKGCLPRSNEKWYVSFFLFYERQISAMQQGTGNKSALVILFRDMRASCQNCRFLSLQFFLK